MFICYKCHSFMDSAAIDIEEILENFGGYTVNNLTDIFEPDKDDHEPAVSVISPYYSTLSMINHLKKVDGDFILLTLNSQSLYSKTSDIEILINQLSEKYIEVSAICIQETWLPPNSDTSLLHIDNFDLITQGYSTTTHGGLAIYINSKYNTEHFFSITESNVCEALFVKVSSSDLPNDIIVGNVYKPPHNNNNNGNIDQFLSDFYPLLDRLSDSNLEIACAGDFNIDLLKINTRNKYSDFLDTMIQNSFFPQITLPTRFAGKSCSLLDNIFCKFSDKIANTSSGILLNKISDHLLCFSSFKFISRRDKRQPKLVKQKIDVERAQQSFLEELRTLDIYSKMDQSLSQDPNINYKILTDTVANCRKKYFPSKFVKFNKRRHKGNKWITYGIITAINKRDRMYRELQALSTNSPRYIELKHNLAFRKPLIKKSIRELKMKYYHDLFEKYKNDIKNTWKTISEIFNKSNRKKNSIIKIQTNGKIISDPSEIANEFNTFFANIGPILAANLDVTNKKAFHSFLKNDIKTNFTFNLIDSSEVEKIIKSLKSKTSFGHDEMTTKLLKKIAPVLLYPITLIINQSLSSGIFPSDLKIAKVIPLHRKE